MYFRLTAPSLSQIRAKFIIEKLGTFPRNVGTINLYATGRTHSGKTTLGNRLLGIDYFLSTGYTNCTQEINLIEFPIGIRFFDLPGACDDEGLENYNRAALGIEQIEDFPEVDSLTVAKYRKSAPPNRQDVSLADFRDLKFEPDLIFYLIASDKLFGRADRKYLRHLLRTHQNVIYVLNMFVSRQNQEVYTATKANINDVIESVIKVHTSVLGKDNKPIIVGVNCWTGEGFSELVARSKEILGHEKGRAFSELINYQQQRTPDEYVRQVKEELLRLLADVALQKPNGTYSSEQPLHKACHALWDFLAEVRGKTDPLNFAVGRDVRTLVDESYAKLEKASAQEADNSEESLSYLNYSISYMKALVALINKRLNQTLFEAQRKAIILKVAEVKHLDSKIYVYNQDRANIPKKSRLYSERQKHAQDELGFLQGVLRAFEKEHKAIAKRVLHDFGEINSRLRAVRGYLAKFAQNPQGYKIETVVKEINDCVDEMKGFLEKIHHFQQQVEGSVAKISINKLANVVIQNHTVHYFDSYGQYQYRGSTYNQFGKEGVALLLSIAHSITADFESAHIDLDSHASKLPEIRSARHVDLLKYHFHSLFDLSFDQAIKKSTFQKEAISAQSPAPPRSASQALAIVPSPVIIGQQPLNNRDKSHVVYNSLESDLSLSMPKLYFELAQGAVEIRTRDDVKKLRARLTTRDDQLAFVDALLDEWGRQLILGEITEDELGATLYEI